MNKEFLDELENEMRIVVNEIDVIDQEKCFNAYMYLNGKLNVLSEIKDMYLKTHKAKTLEELGWKLVADWGKSKEYRLYSRLRIVFSRENNNTWKYKIYGTYNNFYWSIGKEATKAILNKINELEGCDE